MGEVTSIQPLGIVRNTPDKSSRDGSLQEAVNIRFRDGAWRGVGDKVAREKYILTTKPLKDVYYHPVLPEDSYVAHNTDLDTIVLVTGVTSGYSSQTTLVTLSNETFNHFAHINRFLIVYTDLNTYVLFYDDNTGYSTLNNLPVPAAQIGCPSPATLSITVDNGTTAIESVQYCVSEAYKQIADAETRGNFSGNILVRLAWKLFDGSYIMHSTPLYWHVGFKTDKRPQVTVGASTSTMLYYYVGKPELYWMFTSDQLTTISNYKQAGLIQSLCVFMTRTVPSFDLSGDVNNWTVVGSDYFVPVNDEFYKIIENPAYYLVDEIELTSITDTSTKELELVIKDIADVVTLAPLPVDDFSHHTLVADNTYLYNSRLHLGNIIVKLASPGDNIIYPEMYDVIAHTYNDTMTAAEKAYLFGSFAPASSFAGTANTIIQVAELDTEDGTKYVVSELPKTFGVEVTGNWVYDYYTFTDGVDIKLFLKPFASYPDYRCKKLSYYLDDGDYTLLSELTLTGYPLLNIAVVNSAYSNGSPELSNMIYLPTAITVAAGSVATLPTENRYIEDKNRLQVSEQSNPLYFPARHSYRVGNHENNIIAVTSLVDAVSEGQYGQFPLYVFTRSGMFTLSQGEGNVLYANVLPLNNEVLTYKKSFITISGALIFATKHSLMLIAGRTLKELSAPVEGSIRNPLIANAFFINALSDAHLPQMIDNLSTVDFRTFIQECVIAYDKENNELIITRDNTVGWTPLDNYSYTYNFDTDTWATRTYKISGTVIIGGQLYGIRNTLMRIGSVTNPTFDSTIVTIDSTLMSMDMSLPAEI